jgi:hypothetical protein
VAAFVAVLVVEAFASVAEDEETEYVGSLGCDSGFSEDAPNTNVPLAAGASNGFFDRVAAVVAPVARLGFAMLLSGTCCPVTEDCKLKMVSFDALLG